MKVLKYIAELLNESWKLKKELSSEVSNFYINNIYNFNKMEQLQEKF